MALNVAMVGKPWLLPHWFFWGFVLGEVLGRVVSREEACWVSVTQQQVPQPKEKKKSSIGDI